MAVSRFYEKYPEYRNGTKEQYESGELSAVTVLAELGGFDLAGMTGLFLGGAAARISYPISFNRNARSMPERSA